MVVRHLPSNNELMHYGVVGMKWGVRRYQNADGSLTAAGRSHYNVSNNSKSSKSSNKTEANSGISKDTIKKVAIAVGVAAGVSLAAYGGYKLYNKLGPTYLDKTLKNKKLHTLSINDVKDTNRLYASFNKSDVNFYKYKYGNSLLGKKAFNSSYGSDTDDNVYDIVNTVKNMKVASVKNTKNTFSNLYNTNNDFHESVNKWLNSSELTSRINSDWSLNNLYTKSKKGDSGSTYELFNKLGYVNKGNQHADKIQSIFKKELNNKGYSAIYDLNDMFGDYNTKSPIIVLNSDNIIKTVSKTISSTDIETARNKYINSNNAETIYKIVTPIVGSTSIATAAVVNKKDKEV